MSMIMTKKYAIKEIFYSIQGEGYHVGKAAIFIRFTGCNFWNGKEESREKSICKFCDTDFIKTDGQNGGKYTDQALIDKLKTLSEACKYVVLTGGEPLLQVTYDLVQTLKNNDYYVAIETNGSIVPHSNIDWICCSPKALDKLVVSKAHELKVVYPSMSTYIDPSIYKEVVLADHYYIQPRDSIFSQEKLSNVKKCIDFCKEKPLWKLSLQTHKMVGID